MKRILPLCYILLTGAFALMTSCTEDNNPQSDPIPENIPEAVILEFNAKYPNATNVSWSTQDTYAVAHFYLASTRAGGHEPNNTAWFNMKGHWNMTETKISYQQLPDAVKAAFEASPYASWQIDNEIDKLQRNDNNETLYIIEARQREGNVETEVDLYYTEEGILVKEIIDAETDNDYHEYLPQQPEGDIQTWLDQNFSDARIVDYDRESNGTEVEIIADGLKHEILFDNQQQWVYTKTEYGRRSLDKIPADILNHLRTSPYYTNDNAIDDVTKYTTRDNGVYYCFELETGYDDDREVYVNETGIIGRPQNGNGGGNGSVPVADDLQSFIDQKYPGAVILEKDYDHGYLEITLLHDGTEKEVKFNGQDQWVRTEWEVYQLPEAVENVLAAQGYTPNDREFDYVETPDSSWYEVEVRKGRDELKLYISPAGEILRTEYDD